MTKEHDDYLCNKYPKIFVERNMDPKDTCMCWGFPGDGWFDLIDRLCNNIQTYVDLNNKRQVIAEQVKQKFGTLRFYTNYCDDVIRKFIGQAEDESERTCEVCGKPGKLNNSGYICCLCEEHRSPKGNSPIY